MTWDVDPRIFAGLVEEDTDRLYRGLAITIYNNCVQLSPVDTGRYKGNHIVSIGQPNTAYTMGAEGMGLDTSVLNSVPHGRFPTVYIQNNLPYALAIENGHSGQAPTGVYGLAFNSAIASYS